MQALPRGEAGDLPPPQYMSVTRLGALFPRPHKVGLCLVAHYDVCLNKQRRFTQRTQCTHPPPSFRLVAITGMGSAGQLQMDMMPRRSSVEIGETERTDAYLHHGLDICQICDEKLIWKAARKRNHQHPLPQHMSPLICHSWPTKTECKGDDKQRRSIAAFRLFCGRGFVGI